MITWPVLTNHVCLQWEEVSGFDDESNSVRTFQICTPDSPNSYWLRTRWIPRRAATTLYVEIRWVESTGEVLLVRSQCADDVTPPQVHHDGVFRIEPAPLQGDLQPVPVPVRQGRGHAHSSRLDGEPLHQGGHHRRRPPAAAWRPSALQHQARAPGGVAGGGALSGLPEPGRLHGAAVCPCLLQEVSVASPRLRILPRNHPPFAGGAGNHGNSTWNGNQSFRKNIVNVLQLKYFKRFYLIK